MKQHRHRQALWLAYVLIASTLFFSPPSQAEPPFNGKIRFSVKDSIPDWPSPVMAPKGAPNILLVLLDDVGFGATGTFGGPAMTPALDALAARGLRYNNFHTTGICSPTRAALLTGRNHHRVGMGIVEEQVSGFPGYDGVWKKSTASVAEVLRQNGYSTAAVGKWHNTPYREISPAGPFDRWPTGLGFEYFYGFMVGMVSQWEPSLYRNTTPVESPATSKQDYHLTTDLADEAIRWVRTQRSLAPEKPYFLYFATGATHAPLHVAAEWIEKYRGQFDQGWDKLREEVFARQKKLGVIPAGTVLTPRPKELPAWDSLSHDEKKLLARQMEVFAGFMAHTDYEVGRLIRAVQEAPGGDNTLIVYVVGDNGASGDGGRLGHDDWSSPYPSVQDRLDHIDELGNAKFNNHYSYAWGWASATPFQFVKKVPSHFGGTRDPLIVAWPKRIKDSSGLRTQFAHVNDLTPTIYESVGIEPPSLVDGVKQEPLDGTSLVYSFDDPGASSHHRVQYFEAEGNRAIYQNGWIAAARHWAPWDRAAYSNTSYENDHWELYHVERDFSQAHDLAQVFPEKLKEMKLLFDSEARRNNVYPLGGGLYSPANAEWAQSAAAGMRSFVYHADMPRLPMTAVPNFAQSHRIVAHVVPRDGEMQGMIIGVGSRYGGFALYVKDGHLVYHHNYAGLIQDTIRSSSPLPRGEVRVTYEFVEERTDKQATSTGRAKSGVGRLYVNGALVGQRKLSHVVQPAVYFGGLGIGRAFDSPVSNEYDVPFPFTGQIKQVNVDLQ